MQPVVGKSLWRALEEGTYESRVSYNSCTESKRGVMDKPGEAFTLPYAVKYLLEVKNYKAGEIFAQKILFDEVVSKAIEFYQQES